ncbi:MAG: hypothetical protein ACP5JG_10740 [Anaerolineae bacterium]
MIWIVLIGLAILVVVVGFLIYVVSRAPLHRTVDEETDEEEALLALRERYLNGELTKAEYERLVDTLRPEDELEAGTQEAQG